MPTHNIDLQTVPSGSLQPSVPINDAMQVIDALMRPGGIVQDKDLTTPPPTVAGDVGKRWIVAASATGAWSGQDGKIALCTAATVWRFFTPSEGWKAYALNEDREYHHNGSAWVAVTGAAADTSIADAGGYFASATVEGALQELGPLTAGSAWSTVKKTADETRASTATLANDSALSFACLAGTSYRIVLDVFFSQANATMDFKYAMAYSGTITSQYAYRLQHAPESAIGADNDLTATNANLVNAGAIAMTPTVSGAGYVRVELILNTNAAGTFSLQWAQNTLDAGNLTVLRGSYINYMIA